MKHITFYKPIILFLLISSCSKFVEIEPPRTALERSTVFANEETAESAVRGMYFTLTGGSSWSSFTSGVSSITFLTALSADETINVTGSGNAFDLFNNNNLNSSLLQLSTLWNKMYETIYKANAVIEGVSNSVALSSVSKNKYEGEAKVIRAFCHFYLANLFGDVALVLSTDYKINNSAERISVNSIYEYVKKDLVEAQQLLQGSFKTGNIERVRVDWGVATALLARIYLYLGDWPNAEIQATNCINAGPYTLLTNLDNVFLKGSREAIWQLSNDKNNTGDATAFNKKTNVILRQNLIDRFETGDKRKTSWLASITEGANVFYYPFKYKAYTTSPITEYLMVLRLSEQYLIRAEARVQQAGKVAAGIADLNILRDRSRISVSPEYPNPLPPLPTSLSKEQALIAIEQERCVEFFTEWGHRWLDLKRTGKINATLGLVKPGWASTSALYPIPRNQLLNSGMVQNPGYDT